jgi:hypothetical protein
MSYPSGMPASCRAAITAALVAAALLTSCSTTSSYSYDDEPEPVSDPIVSEPVQEESEPAAPAAETQPGGGISWDEAGQHVGTHQRVCGPLMSARTSTDDVFLNLGRDYPDRGRFTIVLWDIGGVEPIASGATLCTSGTITSYEGVAQIELRSTNGVEMYR